MSRDERDAMFALMDRYYEGVERQRFEEDLERKRWCVELHSVDGLLRGFSSQVLLETPVHGRLVRTLFSGDTIVARDCWGSPALLAAFARLAFHLMDRHPDDRLFWFLTTQGYRTYRLLPVFYREFHPRWNVPTPAWAEVLIHAVASRWFPGTYEPSRGVIRTAGTYHLRPGVSDVTSGRLRNPHVRFFRDRNPDHAKGDELCCIAPLTRENFSSAAWRAIRSYGSDEIQVISEQAT